MKLHKDRSKKNKLLHPFAMEKFNKCNDYLEQLMWISNGPNLHIACIHGVLRTKSLLNIFGGYINWITYFSLMLILMDWLIDTIYCWLDFWDKCDMLCVTIVLHLNSYCKKRCFPLYLHLNVPLLFWYFLYYRTKYLWSLQLPLDRVQINISTSLSFSHIQQKQFLLCIN